MIYAESRICHLMSSPTRGGRRPVCLPSQACRAADGSWLRAVYGARPAVPQKPKPLLGRGDATPASFFPQASGSAAMSTTGWVVLGVIVVLVLWVITIYNGLIAMRQRVSQAFPPAAGH